MTCQRLPVMVERQQSPGSPIVTGIRRSSAARSRVLFPFEGLEGRPPAGRAADCRGVRHSPDDVFMAFLGRLASVWVGGPPPGRGRKTAKRGRSPLTSAGLSGQSSTRGKVARTTVPLPSVVSTRNDPPTAATRLAMLPRPKPLPAAPESNPTPLSATVITA